MNDLPPLPDTNDAFELLGIERGASAREIKRAYLRLVKVYKPERAPEQFRAIREAFEAAAKLAEATVSRPGASSPPSGRVSQPPAVQRPSIPTPDPMDPRLAAVLDTAGNIPRLLANEAIGDAAELICSPDWRLYAPRHPILQTRVVQTACAAVWLDGDALQRIDHAYAGVIGGWERTIADGQLVRMRVLQRHWNTWWNDRHPRELGRFLALAFVIEPEETTKTAESMYASAGRNPVAFLEALESLDEKAAPLVDHVVACHRYAFDHLSGGVEPRPCNLDDACDALDKLGSQLEREVRSSLRLVQWLAVLIAGVALAGMLAGGLVSGKAAAGLAALVVVVGFAIRYVGTDPVPRDVRARLLRLCLAESVPPAVAAAWIMERVERPDRLKPHLERLTADVALDLAFHLGTLRFAGKRGPPGRAKTRCPQHQVEWAVDDPKGCRRCSVERSRARTVRAIARQLLNVAAGITIAVLVAKGTVFARRRTTIRFENGDRYDGEVLLGKKDGKGVYTFANGTVYEGEFRDDRISGQGKMTWPGENARVYAGPFVNEAAHGYGRMTWADGAVYVGEFADGVRHGRGSMTSPTGRTRHGVWERDKLRSETGDAPSPRQRPEATTPGGCEHNANLAGGILVVAMLIAAWIAAARWRRA